MKLVNLTPHAVHLMPAGPDGPVIEIPPSGTVSRCETKRAKIDEVTIDGVTVPVNRTEFGKVTGLPDPEEGTFYIVSALVAQAVPYRQDVLIVDDPVRDDQGRIIGARALARV